MSDSPAGSQAIIESLRASVPTKGLDDPWIRLADAEAAVLAAAGDWQSMKRELAVVCGGPGSPRDGESEVAYWLRRVTDALVAERDTVADTREVCSRCGDDFHEHRDLPHVCGGCMIGTKEDDLYAAGEKAGADTRTREIIEWAREESAKWNKNTASHAAYKHAADSLARRFLNGDNE